MPLRLPESGYRTMASAQAVPAMDKIGPRVEPIRASRSLPGLWHRPAAQPSPARGSADLRPDHLPEAIPPEQVGQM